MNKKLYLALFLLFLVSSASIAQIVNPGISDSYDSLENGKISIGGLVDTYYGFDFNSPNSKNRDYSVSSSRHNEFNINLTYLDIKYKNNRVRAHLVPGFGTYMNENYANEKGTAKNLVEANVGVKISKKREIWIDAGVLGSPYTNESAISKDHLMYTRSFAAENVPYYLSGIKLSIPINSKINIYGYLINGWQQIQDNNRFLSFGSQLEYRPNKKMLINWDTYVGNESSNYNNNFKIRYFTDVYMVYKPNERWGFTTCAYIGNQEVAQYNARNKNQFWAQGNFTAAFYTKKSTFLSARIEYFTDQQASILQSMNFENKFSASSLSFAYNLNISSHALFRLENRFFYSDRKIFSVNSGYKNSNNLLIANLTVWF
jgi:hypothetical protein